MQDQVENKFAAPSSQVEEAVQPLSILIKSVLGIVGIELAWLITFFPIAWELSNTGALSALFLLSVVLTTAALTAGTTVVIWRSPKAAYLFAAAGFFSLYAGIKFPTGVLYLAVFVSVVAAGAAGVEFRHSGRAAK